MTTTTFRTADGDNQSVFYREAGPKDAPVLLLLHGFPSSSHMFRNLISALADAYKRDLPDAEIWFFDAGHFALETHHAVIAAIMRDFLARTLNRSAANKTYLNINP